MEELILIKKSGFTLIEMVAVMGILAILLSLGTPYIMSLSKVQEKTSEELLLMSVDDLLRYSKEYCLINGKKGRIRYDRDFDSITFSVDKQVIYEIIYEEKYDVYFTRGVVKQYMEISNKGKLESGSIYFFENRVEKYRITIGVGVDYIEIKDKT